MSSRLVTLLSHLWTVCVQALCVDNMCSMCRTPSCWTCYSTWQRQL